MYNSDLISLLDMSWQLRMGFVAVGIVVVSIKRMKSGCRDDLLTSRIFLVQCNWGYD